MVALLALALTPYHLADPRADGEAKALYRELVSEYGKVTLSGQYDQNECDKVEQLTGEIPAIQGGDFMDYSPSRIARGAHPAGNVEKMIAAARKGQIITMSWHWNAPTDLIDKMVKKPDGTTENDLWYRGFYTSATTFNVASALANPKSADYKLILRDLDAIAAELLKFQKAHIAVLWRPLHEADGGWFWWSAHGPGPYKKLWHLMFQRFTQKWKLHNLIWVFSSSNKAWYPGNNEVDVVGTDAYPNNLDDTLSGTWKAMNQDFPGKLLAITEFGGVPNIPAMAASGIRWSYFVSWSGGEGPSKMTPAALRAIYTNPAVRNAMQPKQ